MAKQNQQKIYYRSLSSLHRMRLTLFCTAAVFCSHQMLVCFINAIGSKLCNLVSCLCNQRSFDGGKPEKLSNFLMQMNFYYISVSNKANEMIQYNYSKKCVSTGFVYFFNFLFALNRKMFRQFWNPVQFRMRISMANEIKGRMRIERYISLNFHNFIITFNWLCKMVSKLIWIFTVAFVQSQGAKLMEW